jgi:signal transduction histidine kinase
MNAQRSPRPQPPPDSAMVSELIALMESLNGSDLDEREAYVDLLGIYLSRADGRPWHRYRNLGYSTSSVANAAFEEARIHVASLEDEYGESEDIGLRIANIYYSRRQDAPGRPLFYFWRPSTSSRRIPHFVVWCLASRESSSGFTPLLLRQVARTALATMRAHLGVLSGSLAVADTIASGDYQGGLARIAQECRADAAILWEFDFDERQFISVEAHGLPPRSYAGLFRVPAFRGDFRRAAVSHRGIVSLVRPESEFIVYDVSDRASWRPKGIVFDEWLPHDRVFHEQGWQSCIAWPVEWDGQMVGAFSVYSSRPARTMRVDYSVRVMTSATAQGSLHSRTYARDMKRLEHQFNDEMDRIGTSLFVLGHIHDFTDNIEIISRSFEQLQLSPSIQVDTQATTELDKAAASLRFLVDLTDSIKRIARGAREKTGRCDARKVLLGLSQFLEQHVVREGHGKVDIVLSAREPAANESYLVAMPALRLERLIFNLVSNAVHWTPFGTNRGVIHVRCHPAEPGGERSEVRIEVEDNGRGVPLELRERIFERFFSQRSDGTGMGLYYSQMFVREAGGSIDLRSREGAGSTFTVHLPVVDRVRSH